MEQQKKIIEFLIQGKTYDFIAKELEVSTKTISRIKKEGVESGLSFPTATRMKKSVNNDTPMSNQRQEGLSQKISNDLFNPKNENLSAEEIIRRNLSAINDTPISRPAIDIYSAIDTSRTIFRTKEIGQTAIAIVESLQYLVKLCQTRARKHPELKRANLTHIANLQGLINLIDTRDDR